MATCCSCLLSPWTYLEVHFSLLPVTTPFCSGTGISFPSLLCAGLSLWSSRSTCPVKPCSTWRPTTARSGRCLWRPGTGRAHPSTCRTMESGLLMSGTMSSKSTEPCLLCWQSLSPGLSVCDFPVPKGINICFLCNAPRVSWGGIFLPLLNRCFLHLRRAFSTWLKEKMKSNWREGKRKEKLHKGTREDCSGLMGSWLFKCKEWPGGFDIPGIIKTFRLFNSQAWEKVRMGKSQRSSSFFKGNVWLFNFKTPELRVPQMCLIWDWYIPAMSKGLLLGVECFCGTEPVWPPALHPGGIWWWCNTKWMEGETIDTGHFSICPS